MIKKIFLFHILIITALNAYIFTFNTYCRENQCSQDIKESIQNHILEHKLSKKASYVLINKKCNNISNGDIFSCYIDSEIIENTLNKK